MNVDQSTHAIPLICTCKKSKWIFWAKPMKCPLQFCVLYFTMIEVEKIKLVWVGSVDIYFVNVGSKPQRSSHQENIYKKINYLKFTDN